MKQNEREKICQKALDTWGHMHQLSMVIEEMAELQIELLKNMNRGKDNIDEIIDECADVEVVLNYVKLHYNIKDEVAKRVKFKLNRLEGRLEDWNRENNK